MGEPERTLDLTLVSGSGQNRPDDRGAMSTVRVQWRRLDYDAAAAVNSADNSEVLAAPKTSDVLAVFAQQVEGGPSPMTPEAFKAIMNEVKAKTGVKGKDLFHPVRIALTGSHSGPEFDKLIPILEEGSRLELPQHVMNVRERLAAFRAARGK